MPVRSDDVSFEGALGAMLSGSIDRPEAPPRAWAIFAHCFTGSKDFVASYHICQALARRGIATLRFDFTGLGHSGGGFADSNFSSDVGDIAAAANFLADNYAAASLLIGHSFGGTAVLAAAGELPEVRGVATVGAPFSPRHVEHLFEGDVDELRDSGHCTATIGGRRFQLQRQFLDDIEHQSMAEKIGALDRPLILFHSPQDEIVGVENAAHIFKAARHPKSFISLMGADHLLTHVKPTAYVASILAQWIEHHMGLSGDDVPSCE